MIPLAHPFIKDQNAARGVVAFFFRMTEIVEHVHDFTIATHVTRTKSDRVIRPIKNYLNTTHKKTDSQRDESGSEGQHKGDKPLTRNPSRNSARKGCKKKEAKQSRHQHWAILDDQDLIGIARDFHKKSLWQAMRISKCFAVQAALQFRTLRAKVQSLR